MKKITQNIGQTSPLLIGRSKEDVIKFLFNQNNNNWRKRNGYPIKRKGLSKRKIRTMKILMVDELWSLFNESSDFISSMVKRTRKYNNEDC